VHYDREWIQDLPREDARVVVRRGGRPITCYAVILEIRVKPGAIRPRWQAVCIIDNHMDKCHMHRYAGKTKLDPEPFGVALQPNEELSGAVRHMVDHHETIIEAWTVKEQ
jgi:hypothetical protein